MNAIDDLITNHSIYLLSKAMRLVVKLQLFVNEWVLLEVMLQGLSVVVTYLVDLNSVESAGFRCFGTKSKSVDTLFFGWKDMRYSNRSSSSF